MTTDSIRPTSTVRKEPASSGTSRAQLERSESLTLHDSPHLPALRQSWPPHPERSPSCGRMPGAKCTPAALEAASQQLPIQAEPSIPPQRSRRPQGAPLQPPPSQAIRATPHPTHATAQARRGRSSARTRPRNPPPPPSPSREPIALETSLHAELEKQLPDTSQQPSLLAPSASCRVSIGWRRAPATDCRTRPSRKQPRHERQNTPTQLSPPVPPPYPKSPANNSRVASIPICAAASS